ncbi:MAG: ABC transporter ATP-binding protein [Acidimicrobiales bacterium]
MHLAGVPEPEPELVASLPDALETLPPDQRGLLTASFVRYLIAREGDAVFRRLLTTPAGHVAEAWKEHYGRSAQQIEAAWRADHEREAPTVGITEFLKMSWRYLRPYRWRQAEVFGYMLLSLAFTVAYPFVTKRMFDVAIPSGEMSEVVMLLGALGAAFAVTLVAGLRQTYQSASISTSVVRDLQEELFGRLQTVPDAWLARHSQGDVLSRMMNDVRRVEAGLTTAIDGGIFQVVSLVVSTIIMLRVNFSSASWCWPVP